MYDDILVPTDGSSESRAAIDHAVDIGTRYGATIHALYVKETSAYASLDEETTDVAAALESQGQQAVETVETTARKAGLDAVTRIGEGSPHEVIVRYVEEHGVDLVAMGTRGRSGLERYVLGSVTERVVRSAPVPVLTVRATDAG